MSQDVPTLAAQAALIASGEASPVELTRMALDRIEAVDPKVNAFITVLPERAMAAARRAEAEIARDGVRGPLHGITYALKDIIDVAGVKTTAHSKLLEDNVASRSAAVTERLESAGMVLTGKVALHEFARGAPTDELPWPNAKNPWNVEHACGGSSSGSGVAVAAGMVPLAIGTDTGGSVRFPAACTNLVGLKPTYGRISRRGVLPLSFSLDHVGPMTRTVEDCALALQALAGHDASDPGSADVPVDDYLRRLREPVVGMRIGIARTYQDESGISDEQKAAVEAVADTLRALGAVVEPVELPDRKLFDAAAWTIILAEGFAVHRHDLQTRPQDYGRTVRERVSIGAFVTGGDYVQAQRLRGQLIAELDRAIGGFDAIVCATAAGAPPSLDKVDDGPWRKSHPITAPFNLTGHPALAVPCGFSSNDLPLSVQFVGKAFAEATLLRIGHAYEQACEWFRMRPAI